MLRLLKKTVSITLALLFFTLLNPFISESEVVLSDADAEWIGGKIFYNECGGKEKCLITWNDGEDFISLGIGHFIWYPENKIGPFDESFPKLLKFMKEKGAGLPVWLEGDDPRCPWQSKKDLEHDMGGEKVCELREFLSQTKSLQLLFILNRLKNALPKLLENAPEESRSAIKEKFYLLASTPAGVYTLVDYVNFSGEGVLTTERYKGQGWGLLQVLERMDGQVKSGKDAICEFARAAEEVLSERVENSPPQRNEKKWLLGWCRRINTYRDAAVRYPD